MKGAVIYTRYSSEKQNEQSIEGQLRICNQYAEANGLTILDTYIDRAMTGTNDHRPAFQQMLADCEKAVPWDIVLVYAIDRFEIYYNYLNRMPPKTDDIGDKSIAESPPNTCSDISKDSSPYRVF